MLGKIIGAFAGRVITVISRLRYGGIALLMGIESACIPIPSETVVPFSRFLVFKGQAAVMVGCLSWCARQRRGSWLAYAVGVWGGRLLAERYGKYVSISFQVTEVDLEFSPYFYHLFAILLPLWCRQSRSNA